MKYLTQEAQKLAPVLSVTDVTKRRIIYQAIAEATVDIYLVNETVTDAKFAIDSRSMVYDLAEIAIIDKELLAVAFRAAYMYKTRKPKTAEECRDSAYFNYPSFDNFIGVTEAYSPDLIASINADFETFQNAYRLALSNVSNLVDVELADVLG